MGESGAHVEKIAGQASWMGLFDIRVNVNALVTGSITKCYEATNCVLLHVALLSEPLKC